MRMRKRLVILVSLLCLSLALCGCSLQVLPQAAQLVTEDYSQQQAAVSPALDLWTSPPDADETPAPQQSQKEDDIAYGKAYTAPEDVALYLHTYSELPPNFITKGKAKELGWEASEGNLQDVAPGMSIGGDYFSNYEKTLPTAKGRKWYECDVNYDGGYRAAERILYSNDGMIYYTDDHYKTFTQLY